MKWLLAFWLAFFAVVWMATSPASGKPGEEYGFDWIEIDPERYEDAYFTCTRATEMRDLLMLANDYDEWADLVFACTLGVRAATETTK